MKKIKLNSEITAIVDKNVATGFFDGQEFKIKKALVKKVSKKLVDFSKEIPRTKEGNVDWVKIKSGTPVSATIAGTFVVGKIQKEYNNIFICQNKKRGCSCNKKTWIRIFLVNIGWVIR